MDNQGDLYDINGPSSLGSLPTGPVVPRDFPVIFTDPQEGYGEFAVGARERTSQIPFEYLTKGQELFEDALVAKFAHRDPEKMAKLKAEVGMSTAQRSQQ